MEETWKEHGMDMEGTWKEHGRDMEGTWNGHGRDMEGTMLHLCLIQNIYCSRTERH